jgi:hypothetical protein
LRNKVRSAALRNETVAGRRISGMEQPAGVIEPSDPGEEAGPAWLESQVLFARFWTRLGAIVGSLFAGTALTAVLDRWDRLHQWSSGLTIAGFGAWAVSLILFLALSVAGGLRRGEGSESPPAAALLPYALVLAFAGLVPLGAGILLATLFP